MSIYVKANVVIDPRCRANWRIYGDHRCRCQVCHATEYQADWRGLQVHHIIHGSNGRSDEPCNFLLVCGICHGMIHDDQYCDSHGVLLPKITLGNVLWVKSHCDDGTWDEERLEVLYHRALPAWTILPAHYLNERAMRRAA